MAFSTSQGVAPDDDECAASLKILLEECGRASVLADYDEQVIAESLKGNSKNGEDNAEYPEDIRNFTPVMTAQWKALLADLVSTKVKEGTILKVGAELMLEISNFSWVHLLMIWVAEVSKLPNTSA